VSGPLSEDEVAQVEHQALQAASPMLQVPAVIDEASLRSAVRYADRQPRRGSL
jgi:hypothetical protein